MKDFKGQEVSVGDEVITTAKHYRSLVRGKVISVAPQSVLVEYLNTWNYGAKGRLETYRVTSSQFVLA